MCGLAGAFLFRGTQDVYAIENAVQRMCDRMQGRGPDAFGYWSDSEAGLSLGHRRLSMLVMPSFLMERYITSAIYAISWKLCTNMRTEDVTDTLDLALAASGCG
jgi:hypothetical protein